MCDIQKNPPKIITIITTWHILLTNNTIITNEASKISLEFNKQILIKIRIPLHLIYCPRLFLLKVSYNYNIGSTGNPQLTAKMELPIMFVSYDSHKAGYPHDWPDFATFFCDAGC